MIVGSRERRELPGDKEVVIELLQDMVKKHSTRLHILSVGCDKGIGKVVRDYCLQNKVVFVEVRVKLEGEEIPRVFFAHMFLARNSALLEVGDEYHIFKGPNPNGIIEALISPAKNRVGDARVKVYDEERVLVA